MKSRQRTFPVADDRVPPGGFVGVDPGKSGGLAYVIAPGKAWAWKCPETEADLWALFLQLSRAKPRLASLERVHAMPKQGVSSSFKFGSSFGELRMALLAARIPFQLVTPRKWQQTLSCLSGGDKNITKAKAQELFPRIKMTHAIADALLLAEYARRTERR